MSSFGTRRVEIRPINDTLTPDIGDFSTSFGQDKDFITEDKHFHDTVPCEDIDDGFDTQVLDLGDETQPVDIDEETQIMDLAGETQVMDDYDFIEHMDTQLLDVSDNENEWNNDTEGGERTQLLHDTEEISDRRDGQVVVEEEDRTHTCHQEDEGTRTESRPSSDTAPSSVTPVSGSLRRGFTAIRTASLRAAGLAARKMALKNAESESCSTGISSGCSMLRSFRDSGVPNVETVDAVHDKEKDCEKELGIESNSKVARSLVKKLFVEEDVAEEGSSDSFGGGRTDMPQWPACDDGMAGLSYVDSQEPGELSQANALEFVDKFLKVSALETVGDATGRNATGEIVSPGATAKGPQNLAQQTNRRSILAEASVFDWDDTHEDEGGGDFFTKKKEVLLGTSSGSRKGGLKPRSTRLQEPRNKKPVGRFRNEKEQQNIHDKLTGFGNSNSMLVKNRKIGEPEEISIKKKLNDYTNQQMGSYSGSGTLFAAETNAEVTDMMSVGIDTQMAAEAMEALSTGSTLVANDSSTADPDYRNGRGRCEREATNRGLLEQSCGGERGCLSSAGVSTRSKQTKGLTTQVGTVALRTRSQYVIKELNIDTAKPKANRRRLNMKKISVQNGRESSDIEPVNVGVEARESILERGLSKSGSVPVKRWSSRGKGSSSTPVARRTRQYNTSDCLNDAVDASCDSSGQRHCLDVAQAGKNKRKRSTRGDVASKNNREETLNASIVTDIIKVDGSSCRERDIQHTSNKFNESGKKQSLLMTSGGHEVVLQSIARRTRSKRSARCAEAPQEDEGLHSRAMLSLEDVRQMSSKPKACSSPSKEAVSHVTLEGSHVEVPKSASPANITPVKFKTPKSAVSPICVGNEYPTPSCKKRLTLKKELLRLTADDRDYSSPAKDLRQRRDINRIRVLFSQHLDQDIIRQQKKILSRLGVPVASSVSEATHFVADMFVRTRNMLEAIANCKPVVTHLWLESCGQASCFVDEKNYILRDAKKERELGFSMPISLARASRHPLLEGRKVLVTPNVKPGKEIISSLVKAVRGQAIERLCRSLSNKDRLPDDLLVLSCEEDFEECVPLLEKGIAVYSSELLLNGIITQKLEYERYRIFVDHVKKTRSTLWMKKDGDRFIPVTRTK